MPIRFHIWLALLFVAGRSIFGAPSVALIVDDQLALPIPHGIDRLQGVLREKKITVVRVKAPAQAAGPLVIVGMTGASGKASELLRAQNLKIPQKPESILIQRTQLQGKEAILVAGSDPRGLMYALLEVASRIADAPNASRPFSEIRNTIESPDVPERAVSIYTMQKRYFEERLFNEDYWKNYFDMLAENRFDAFVVVFGYENGGYFAPAYPYFFDVEGFPEVHVTDFSAGDQKKYTAAFRRMVELAHERGLKFTAGLWDHVYRGGVQSGGVKTADPDKTLAWVPTGLTKTNLMEYSAAAFAKFLRTFPDIDAVQFRMHSESGLKPGEEMREFWKRIYQVVKEVRPDLQFNARAKEFPDELIDLAVQMGVNIRICTKYWAEQMGLPFHPTHVNRQNQHDRRHGYADLLRYPQKYKMHWRLWNGGTTRVLLWGDPEYVRRFAESTHLYDGDGFEINEMLATKMEAQPHDAAPFDLLQPEYRYYKYEFQRYWHFYQVFGRVSYNPNVSPELWDREFTKRFGPEAGPHIEEALHTASWILPRINASIFPYNRFPTTRGWIEKQHWEDLPTYAKAEGSDIQQFESFSEAVSNRLNGTFSAKISPEENRRWFGQTAVKIYQEMQEAEKAPKAWKTKEFISTLVDLKILRRLALYHSDRIDAALNYMLFKRSNDVNALDKAIDAEQEAIGQWRAIVEAADGVYTGNLMMGLREADLSGHWRDELGPLEKGLDSLKKERASFKPIQAIAHAPDLARSEDTSAPVLVHKPVKFAAAGEPLRIAARVTDSSGVKSVRLLYRSVTQYEDFKTLEMKPAGDSDSYEVTVPGAELDPKWDFMYLFEVMDRQGNGKIYPDLEKETPYLVVKLQRGLSR